MTESAVSLPRVITEPLGGGTLARAALSDRPPEFYVERPSSVSGWTARANEVRAGLKGDWLDALRAGFGPTLGTTAAGERLARSAGGRGIVVTTGQQPGLFGGPIYTWSKALSALALADELQRLTGVPVAPVFWAATDDADFAEASVTHIARGADVLTLRHASTAAEGVPMADVGLGADVGALLETLVDAGGSAAFAHVWEIVRGAYLREGQTVGGAYVALLRALLEPLGIAVLDASHPATRAAADPVLRAALRRAADVERALDERDAGIAGAGHDVQVPAVRGLSLVFATGNAGEKTRVRVADAGRVAVDAATGALGPNVLLRPVVERAILPTVAYVAGPGELAYFAQVGAVAQALDAAPPLAVPRWSCTLLERGVERVLARRGLEPADLSDAHAAEGRLARAALPADVRASLAGLRAAIDSAAKELTGGDAPFVPPAAVEGARRSMELRVDRLERRFVAAAKRRAADAMRDLAVARASLYPNGKRQERTLNFLPFLARYGRPLVDAMRAAAAAHAERLVVGAAADAPAAAAPGARPAATH